MNEILVSFFTISYIKDHYFLLSNSIFPMSDTVIVSAAIHPAIGISRLGNSQDEFFFAPEVSHPPPREPGFYRDAKGALKREAARFRIYGYNQAGEVVRELTTSEASITWTVHVTNRKAAWYQWQIAMDIPEAAANTPPLRNATVTDRQSLVIDPGAQSISGVNASPVPCTGAFTGTSVNLGELRTDEAGRLIFLPGLGVSASPTGSTICNNNDPFGFINADGWYDDTCDGPVSATVVIGGQTLTAQSAWVLSAPPNYAPQVKAERTMYDLLFDLYVQNKWLAAPSAISFTNDVYPILQRLSGLQWVNQGFASQFGHGGRYNFEDPAFVRRLATQNFVGGYDLNAELRRQTYNSFRPAAPADGNQLPWPWLYGDAMEVPASLSPRENAAITQTQQNILLAWANGDFIEDWGDPALKPPASLEDVPLAGQPAMLDRAALEFCLADAFHPGCEMTWPMRHITMFSAPFRFNLRAAGTPQPGYGPVLTQEIALSPTGPLNQQGPGDITQWMGLPWQADTAWCRSGYDTSYDPYAPSFWPARVPNHVLIQDNYKIVLDPAQPHELRLKAFNDRTDWNAPLDGNPQPNHQMEEMVRIFGSMGVLEVRKGVTGDPAFPETMMVASFGPDVKKPAPHLLAALDAAPAAEAAPRTRPGNFHTHKEALAAPLPVHRKK